jgi:hypothetical protein
MDVDWFKKHWSTIVTLGCVVIAALVEAWQQAAANVSASIGIPRLEGVWHYVPLILLIIAGIVWLVGRRKSAILPPPQTAGVVPGIPTLSALLGQNPSVDFNAKKFFALAHYSPVTAEIEKNMKIIAQQNSPNDKEAFYARILGCGLVAYHHDWTWFMIYGSQLAALAELNSRGLIPIAELKKHYDKAAADNPKTYEDYSFEQWLDYLKSRMLIATYPSLMIEMSFHGKDFLKYLSHVARDKNARSN